MARSSFQGRDNLESKPNLSQIRMNNLVPLYNKDSWNSASVVFPTHMVFSLPLHKETLYQYVSYSMVSIDSLCICLSEIAAMAPAIHRCGTSFLDCRLVCLTLLEVLWAHITNSCPAFHPPLPPSPPLQGSSQSTHPF